MPNHFKCFSGCFIKSTEIDRNVLVTTIAENKLTATPKANVIAKPLTKLAPNVDPNQKRIEQVISVAIFESLIDGHARFQPNSIA